MNKGNSEVQDGSGAGFITGLFTGALIGAGLGLLFAPRSGSELRGQLADSATSAGKTIADGYQRASRYVSETADDLSTRGRQVYTKARKAVAEVGSDAERMASEAAETGAKVFSAAGHESSKSEARSRS